MLNPLLPALGPPPGDTRCENRRRPPARSDRPRARWRSTTRPRLPPPPPDGRRRRRRIRPAGWRRRVDPDGSPSFGLSASSSSSSPRSHIRETSSATASGRDAMADLARGSPARRNSAPAAAPLAAAEDARDSRGQQGIEEERTSVSAGRPSGSADAMAARAFAAWRASRRHLARAPRRSAPPPLQPRDAPLPTAGPWSTTTIARLPGPRTRERSAATAPGFDRRRGVRDPA